MKNNFSEEDIKDLKRVRNYFGEHDVSMFEHAAYKIIDDAIKKLTLPSITNCPICGAEIKYTSNEIGTMKDCPKCPYSGCL